MTLMEARKITYKWPIYLVMRTDPARKMRKEGAKIERWRKLKSASTVGTVPAPGEKAEETDEKPEERWFLMHSEVIDGATVPTWTNDPFAARAFMVLTIARNNAKAFGGEVVQVVAEGGE